MDRMTEINSILEYLQKKQTAKRFHHTLGVAYTATAMAMQFDVDIKSAEIAGLLHDCAKYMDDNKCLDYCKKYKLHVTEVEKRNPFLLHGKIGAHMANELFGVVDEDIINAIRNHTTGRPDMSPLEKIIFIADYIEEGRKKFDSLEEARKLAYEDIDKTMAFVLYHTIEYVKLRNRPMHPLSLEAYEFYKDFR